MSDDLPVHRPVPIRGGLAGWEGIAEPRHATVRQWSLHVGRGGITFCSVRQSFGMPPATTTPRRTRPAVLAAVAAAGTMATIFAGATAGMALTRAPAAYRMAIAVPAPVPLPRAAPAVRTPPRATRRVAPDARVAPPALDDEVGSAAAPDRAQATAIAAAFTTGEMQEWAATGGGTGFAVAGPAEAAGPETCRAIAVLIRSRDGRSDVTSTRRCAPFVPRH